MQPFTLLIKPSGSNCNLDCRYCFYKDRDPGVGQGRQRMSREVLVRLVKEYMQLGFDAAGFAWQGGEPTLMGLEFFREAVALQKEFGRRGQQVSNKIQTNGVLLDEAWCRFFRENRFLLGISIDGPEPLHDGHRVDHAGAGTFGRVMRGIEACKEHEVEFNALVVLNDLNVERPDELFGFLVKHDLTYIQFIPCIERDPATGGPTAFSITPRQYGGFLCRMFDLWWGYGPGKLNIREFDSLTTYYVLGQHSMCTYSRECAGFVVMEHTGEAFCCEFFVEPRWRLGNILERPLADLAGSVTKREFARQKTALAGQCLVCRHTAVCRGGCVKDRIRVGDGGPSRPSWFCESYKQFFDHSLPRLKQLAAAIAEGSATRHTRAANSVRLRIQ